MRKSNIIAKQPERLGDFGHLGLLGVKMARELCLQWSDFDA